MATDRHGQRELTIFVKFAKICPLDIVPRSIERRHPPEPDILCKVNGKSPTAFEMVELIDTDLATRILGGLKLKRLIEDGLEKLSSKEKREIKRRLSNALVHVAFNPQASFRTRRDIIPEILKSLTKISRTFVGNLRLNTTIEPVPCVKRTTIRRGSFIGPCFDVEAAGSFADPTVEKVQGKFSKTYKTSNAVELLAYYELQPVLKDSFWLPQLRDFVRKNLKNSPFRRVWIFDLPNQTIRYVYPKFL